MSATPTLPTLDKTTPVLIAGPTASGKSDLALQIAETHGGVTINADASQVYDCWRVITARPSAKDEARAPHALYGHVGYDVAYSVGHWLRDVTKLLTAEARPIIVGGTGLYFTALTQGIADIPLTPPDVRAEADEMTPEALLADLDDATRSQIDVQNRARVQRAWEVLRTTGKSITEWQAQTARPLLPLDRCIPIVFDVPKDWLEARIRTRFDRMIAAGALDEVKAMQARYDPALPSCRAIGVPELMAHLNGEMSLDQARDRSAISTRQFAKRQRTWFRSKLSEWHQYRPPEAQIA